VGVETDIEIRLICAGLEEQCVAFGTEVVGLHLLENSRGSPLNVSGGHAGIEDINVRAEESGIGRGDIAREGGRWNDKARSGQNG
jgi:hypothetical protein